MAAQSLSMWGRSFVFIKKTKIKSWKAIFIVAFIAGSMATLLWSINLDIQATSNAAVELVNTSGNLSTAAAAGCKCAKGCKDDGTGNLVCISEYKDAYSVQLNIGDAQGQYDYFSVKIGNASTTIEGLKNDPKEWYTILGPNAGDGELFPLNLKEYENEIVYNGLNKEPKKYIRFVREEVQTYKNGKPFKMTIEPRFIYSLPTGILPYVIYGHKKTVASNQPLSPEAGQADFNIAAVNGENSRGGETNTEDPDSQTSAEADDAINTYTDADEANSQPEVVADGSGDSASDQTLPETPLAAKKKKAYPPILVKDSSVINAPEAPGTSAKSKTSSQNEADLLPATVIKAGYIKIKNIPDVLAGVKICIRDIQTNDDKYYGTFLGYSDFCLNDHWSDALVNEALVTAARRGFTIFKYKKSDGSLKYAFPHLMGEVINDGKRKGYCGYNASENTWSGKNCYKCGRNNGPIQNWVGPDCYAYLYYNMLRATVKSQNNIKKYASAPIGLPGLDKLNNVFPIMVGVKNNKISMSENANTTFTYDVIAPNYTRVGNRFTSPNWPPDRYKLKFQPGELIAGEECDIIPFLGCSVPPIPLFDAWDGASWALALLL